MTQPPFGELLRQPGVVETLELRSTFGLMAFHGGLEGGTEVIAAEAAALTGASLYTVVQPATLTWHVPSAEVSAAQSEHLARFLDHVEIAVAIHGYGRPGRPLDLLLGGSNRVLATHLAHHLRVADTGFAVVDDLAAIPAELRGMHPDNPVNRPHQGGVQLELPPRARGASPSPADRGQKCTPAPGIVAALATAVLHWSPASSPRPQSNSKVPPALQ
jgi:phage replication-related protein YjqB (UPF0714/DUF867 family)